jgi:chromosome segregation ATPase
LLATFFDFVVFTLVPRNAMLTGFGPLAAGARHRARDKYGVFDQMGAELRQLRERCNAFDALADALGTPDSWLSYRAEALRDQLQEYERQDAVRPSTLERVCTALIDRDEALQKARGELERMRTLASNWEAEVAAVRSDNLELHSLLRGAQA